MGRPREEYQEPAGHIVAKKLSNVCGEFIGVQRVRESGVIFRPLAVWILEKTGKKVENDHLHCERKCAHGAHQIMVGVEIAGSRGRR